MMCNVESIFYSFTGIQVINYVQNIFYDLMLDPKVLLESFNTGPRILYEISGCLSEFISTQLNRRQ